ncbi:MAG: tetratricopeptide repeat protein [Gemmatimonadales bacterium]
MKLFLALGLMTCLAGVAGAQDVTSARLAYQTGEYSDAIRQYRRLVGRQPSNGEVVRGLVRALMVVGHYDDAIEVGFDAPAEAAAYNPLGEALMARGRWADAEKAFQAALQDAPDSLTARLNLALLAQRRGELEEATRGFDHFIDVYNANRTQLTVEELVAVATAVKNLGRDNPNLFHDATRAYQEALTRDPDYMRAEVMLGQLFLEKYDGSEARASFDAVITRNPNDPAGLIGMAKALRFANEPGHVELAEQALEVNSAYVEAFVFLAMYRLEVQEREEAEELIDRALAIDPRSLEALSVLAALRFIENDDGAFDDVERRVLNLNPRYADFYNTVADAAVRGRLYEQAAGFAHEAIEIDPKSWRAYGLLGINQLRTSMMDSGRTNLEKGFEGDPFDVWTKNTLDLLDDLDEYTLIESDHFVFAIETPEAELLATYVTAVAEDAYDAFLAKYRYTPPQRIRVEIFPTRADFSVRTIGITGMGALGVSFGPVIAMDAPAAYVRIGMTGDQAYFNWGSTLWHEIAHSFHLGMSNHRVPRWFTEGLAVYEERRARLGWGDGPTPEFLVAYREGKLWPVSELENGFVRPRYPQQLLFSYYQSSLVCELVARDYGEAAFRRLLASFRSGASSAEAFERALGVSLDRFDELFDEFVQAKFAGELDALRGYSLDPEEQPSEREIAARATDDPDDFLAQLTYGVHLLEGGSAELAIPHLERARQLFPGYAGTGSPYWFLAAAKRRTGDLEGAAAELEALLTRNAGHYGAAVELGAIQDSLGNAEGVRWALDRVMFVYPYEVEAHTRLADVAANLEDWPIAIRERRALVALDPVNRARALYRLARVYYHAGDIGAARKTVLAALETAPNFAEAQDLLLDIMERRPGSER